MTQAASHPGAQASPATFPASRKARLVGAILTATFGSSASDLDEHLASGRLQRALDELSGLIGKPAPRLPRASLVSLQEARVELFTSNPAGLPAPPYAGLAIDGEILGPAVDRLQALLQSHGFETNPSWTELPDHLAVIGAVLANDACPEDLARGLETEYLRPWLERYAGALAGADRTGVFSMIANFLAEPAASEVSHETRA